MAASYLELYEEGEVEISTCPTPHQGKNSAGFVARPLIAAIYKLCLCVCLLGLFSVIQHSGQKMARKKSRGVRRWRPFYWRMGACSFYIYACAE